ncbi:phage tail sheath subtilisin-like domain-containing protein [Amycolatopsis sp. H6(2020)]|nr:phage tail sheath subtilisin-like domain-containing protein [Amycolatopsis sp. H6(2020)]
MAFNVGVNVVEVDGTGSPSITGAAVSVGAFTVLTKRGVPHQPVRVTTYPQFIERFGGYFTGGFGAYLVKGFFDNGGQTAYVSRVVDTTAGSGASAAKRTLADAAATNVLTVEAGFRGQADPGAWGRSLFLRVRHSASATTRLRESAPATITGTALAAAVNMATLPTLSVQIDESSVATELKFVSNNFANPAAATRVEIRDAINGQTNLLRASIGGAANDQLVLTSTGESAAVTGKWTGLQVTANNSTLGFATMANPTLGALEPLVVGGGKFAVVRDFGVGDAVVISDGTTTAHAVLSAVDTATGAVAWTPDLPNLAAFTDHRKVTLATSEFDLVIADGAGDAEHVVETHTGLSMQPDLPNYAPRVLNHPLSGSKQVRLIDLAAPNRDRPAATAGWVALQGGGDGTPTATHFIGDEAAGTGLFAFNAVDIQLLCCERTDSAIAKAALAYCANRGDAMFVGAVPEGAVAGGQAVAYGTGLQAKKAYGALYGPWIIVPDPIGIGNGPRITIPPTGHVMGVFARIETTRGIWKAPAGDEANLLGVLDVESRLSDADHTDLVTNGCVNGVRAVPRAGIVVDASRTLSTDPRWRFVNVRLLFNFVKSSLRDGLRWVRQEPNRDSLWTAVRYGTVSPFLMGLWRQGAFGTGSAEQTFTVVVDASNNPPDQVEQGKLTIEVYFYPSRPAETIVIMVGQQPSGASVAEA